MPIMFSLFLVVPMSRVNVGIFYSLGTKLNRFRRNLGR